MAKIEYGGGVTAITGHIGGTVFQQNGSGFIIRAKGNARKLRTFPQNEHLAQYQSVRKLWYSLDLSQKEDWNTFASLHIRTDRWGQTKSVNGIAWFSSINWFRQLSGESALLTPPTYDVPAAVPAWDFDYDATTLWVTIDSGAFTDDHGVIISCSECALFGSKNRRSVLRFMKYFDWRIDDIYEFADEWESIFHKLWVDGHPSGTQIIVQVQLVWKASGIVGPASTGVFEIT